MHTTGAELLHAVLAGGDDERLVYADWLEQRGDPLRAQIIHLQCEHARLERWERRRLELDWELAALLAELGDRWRSELPVLAGVEWVGLERGFASTVRVTDTATLYRHAQALAAAAPVHRVELARLTDDVDVHEPVPWLRALRVELVAALSGRHPLLGTPDLELHDFDADWFPGTPIERLAILDTNNFGGELAAALAAADWAAELRALELPTWFDDDSGYGDDPRLGADGVRSLLALAKLEVLNIDRQRVGAKALATLFTLSALRELSARDCGAPELELPKAGKAGASFRALDLGGNAIGNAGAVALAALPRLAQIRSLTLDACEIEAVGVAALAGQPLWHELRRLDLSRNRLGAAGLRVLADAPAPAQLHTLRIADAGIDAAAAHLLGKIGWLPRLSVLDLSGNRLSHGALVLRELEVGALRDLGLAAIGMGRTEAAALARLWPALVRLDLSGNAVTDSGLERFATTKEAAALQTLRLADCHLTDDGLALLAERARTPRLRELVLGKNTITARGIERLLGAPFVAALETLDLGFCNLAADAIAVLAAARPPPRLRRLRLRGNDLDERSLLRLANSTTLRGIQIEASGRPWTYSPATSELLVDRLGDNWYAEGES